MHYKTKRNDSSPRFVSAEQIHQKIRQNDKQALDLLKHPGNYERCLYDAQLIVRRATCEAWQEAGASRAHKRRAERLQKICDRYCNTDADCFQGKNFWELRGVDLESPLVESLAGPAGLQTSVVDDEECNEIVDFITGLPFAGHCELGLGDRGDQAAMVKAWLNRVSDISPVIVARTLQAKSPILGIGVLLPERDDTTARLDPNLGRPVVVVPDDCEHASVMDVMLKVVVLAVAPSLVHRLRVRVHASRQSPIKTFCDLGFKQEIKGMFSTFESLTKTDEEYASSL